MSRMRSPSSSASASTKTSRAIRSRFELGGAAQHHAARAGADHYDIAKIFIKQKIGDFRSVGFGRDAGAQRMLTLGAAVQ